MARMHSRAKGKSKSRRPLNTKQPSWVRYKDKEAELLIVKLSKEGKTPSEIGAILRDTYGIPYAKQVVGKKITKVLKDHKISPKIPEDIMALIKKEIALKKHLENNHKDEEAKRGITLTESKIKRLAKYYKRTKRLPENWKYQPDKIKLLLE